MTVRILYDREVVQVTPDTARDLINRGLASLVSGDLAEPEPDPPAPPDLPAETPAKIATAAEGKVTNVPKGKKTASRKGGHGAP